MPKVTIWIRNDDLPAWNKISDRAMWLHDQLSYPMLTVKVDEDEVEKPVEKLAAEILKRTCKNGHPSSNGRHCFNMKCVYSG